MSYEHKHWETETVELITERATKGPTGGKHPQAGDFGQRDESLSGWDLAGRLESSSHCL